MDGAMWKRAVSVAFRRTFAVGGLLAVAWSVGGAAQAAEPPAPVSIGRPVVVTDTVRHFDGLHDEGGGAQPQGAATDGGVSWVRGHLPDEPQAMHPGPDVFLPVLPGMPPVDGAARAPQRGGASAVHTF